MTDEHASAARRRQAFALLATAQFAVVLDITIVNVALPSIETALGFSRPDLAWVVDAYLLTFGGFLLLGGRAADLLGRKRIFLTGLVTFGLASVACGLAETGWQLVAARAVQGLGGAMLSPAGLSLVAVTFQEETERNRAMGTWTAVSGAGGATGVVLGGVLTHALGWPWVFWVNAPLTLGAALLGIRLITDAGARRCVSAREFDVLGALTATAGLTLLIFGLVQAGEHGLGSSATLAALGAAAFLLVGFALTELRASTPLISFDVFRSGALCVANAMMVVFMAGVVATNFFVTLYAQQVIGYGPVGAGLSLLPLALGQVVFARIAARRLVRVGVLRTLLTGMGAAVLGYVWFSFLSPRGSFAADILGPAALVSVGGGFGFVVLIVLSVSGVEPRRAGLAGGLINMSQQVGGALGLALLASLATWWTAHEVHHGVAARQASTDGFRLGFLAAAALVTAGTIAATFTLRTRAERTRASTPDPPPETVSAP
ncbi:MFS transporter [Streptomyces sp. CA-249302]|uniref:MFS transporter n=1 Tax=Streptomyces sp. CA-249302 TaxID=3240058 RepID=UPI003D9461D7